MSKHPGESEQQAAASHPLEVERSKAAYLVVSADLLLAVVEGRALSPEETFCKRCGDNGSTLARNGSLKFWGFL